MSTIVVPLDGSLHAQSAIRPAVAFAACAGNTDVLLLSCVDREEEQASTYLEAQADRFRGVVHVGTRVLSEVAADDGILGTLSTPNGSTLCMASRGRGGLRTAVLGSVASAVIARSTSPMIVVGPASRSVLLPGERGDIVVCSDGSTFSAAIMPAARTWAGSLRLDPWLVEVVPPDELVAHGDEPPRNREVEAGNERLRRLRSGFEGGGLTVNQKVLHGQAPSSLVAFAEQCSASLMALTTRGRTGLAGLGGVATGVIRQSPCPVLLVRPTT